MRHRRETTSCFPGGYRWCGPGCSGPGEPINDIDAICKAHDMCYRRSRDRCKCDKAFLERMRLKIDPRTAKGRHARTMYNYMRLQSLFTCGLRRF
ncbi:MULTISPECIES: phospholipase [Clostridia]|uniref:phospholipase n=1 Tax=Clostridia TaxID=186801 RepID=UPI000EA0EB23|nr:MULTISPECIES: phospholipase [Clostridia]NBJ69465.1 phospholipase [Roseburia sp. 1XD42-34]RKI78540.1 phospholipase [Clostridium sp. 1xD42-85]